MTTYSNFIEMMDFIEMHIKARSIPDKQFPAVLYKLATEIYFSNMSLFDSNVSKITISPHCGRHVVANCILAPYMVISIYPAYVTWYITEFGLMSMEMAPFLSTEQVSRYSEYFAKKNNTLEYSISTSIDDLKALSILTVPMDDEILPCFASAHLANDALPSEVFLLFIKIFQKGIQIPEKAIHYFILFYCMNFIKNGNCWYLKKDNRYVALITNREVANNMPLTVAYGIEYFISKLYSEEKIMEIFLSFQMQLNTSEARIYSEMIDYIIGDTPCEKRIESLEIQNLSISIQISNKADRIWILQNMIKPIMLSYIRNKNMRGMMEFMEITQQIIPGIQLSQYCLFLLYLANMRAVY